MRRLLATIAGLLAAGCSPAHVESTTAGSSSSTEADVSDASTSAEPCFFEERPSEADDDNPECGGLAEDACEAAAACQTIHGRLVETCRTDAVVCESEDAYLGCVGLVVCKSEFDFFCPPDLSSTYVAQRRCNPPPG